MPPFTVLESAGGEGNAGVDVLLVGGVREGNQVGWGFDARVSGVINSPLAE